MLASTPTPVVFTMSGCRLSSLVDSHMLYAPQPFLFSSRVVIAVGLVLLVCCIWRGGVASKLSVYRLLNHKEPKSGLRFLTLSLIQKLAGTSDYLPWGKMILFDVWEEEYTWIVVRIRSSLTWIFGGQRAGLCWRQIVMRKNPFPPFSQMFHPGPTKKTQTLPGLLSGGSLTWN